MSVDRYTMTVTATKSQIKHSEQAASYLAGRWETLGIASIGEADRVSYQIRPKLEAFTVRPASFLCRAVFYD